jgi:hypothetical protein
MEALAVERHGLEPVPGDEVEEPDARGTDGTPIEVKACRERIENGDEYGAAGRWFLRKRAHDALLAQDGCYLLVVYDGEADPLEVLRESFLPATYVDHLVTSWTPVDRRGEEAVAKLSHAGVVPEGVRNG